MTVSQSVCLLVEGMLGRDQARSILAVLDMPRALGVTGAGNVGRAEVAQALNVALFAGLLDHVPTAARYVAGVAGRGERVCFDHGALRTIDGETGALPRGHLAFERILAPLGYAVAGLYPLPRLRMTGRAYAHRDRPEGIPQFFVSELHVSELPETARTAAARVFGASTDPLGPDETALLDQLGAEGAARFDLAAAGLPGLVRAFRRQHPECAVTDYETLLASSAEAAWIATEGNAFNHATDRVANVEALSEMLKAQGFPMKERVEVAREGRVRQTAFLADKVVRRFVGRDGGTILREVPGSFYEFITREREPAGALDLNFDSSNATGIFAVTRA